MRAAVRFHLGEELYGEAKGQLAAWDRGAAERRSLAAQAERDGVDFQPYSAWGERVDEVRVSPAYLELGRIGVRAGIAGLPYEPSVFGERARVLQSALIVLWAADSAGFGCPLAIADAAARTLLEHGASPELDVVRRLTSRDPDIAWTSGQWMTEAAGGSDVGPTTTTARLDPDGGWRLYGVKSLASGWPTDIGLTLARPAGGAAGARGLALFWVPRLLEGGAPNCVRVRRLRDKLGTRALPTVELELDGALAHPLGEPSEGGGVRRIATALAITRVHNAAAAAAALGRGRAWALAYAQQRVTFGRRLLHWPGHRVVLSQLAADYAAALALALRCAELLGRVEHGTASQHEQRLLRGLTPIAKLATARWAVAGVAEAMEAASGFGYCEDSTVPTMVRDAHVLPIWEGSTNVLALDFLRAAATGSLEALITEVRQTLAEVQGSPLVAGIAAAVQRAVDDLTGDLGPVLSDPGRAQAGARALCLSLARIYAAARLCLQASCAPAGDGQRAVGAAEVLLARGLAPRWPSPAAQRLAADDPAPVCSSADIS